MRGPRVEAEACAGMEALKAEVRGVETLLQYQSLELLHYLQAPLVCCNPRSLREYIVEHEALVPSL